VVGRSGAIGSSGRQGVAWGIQEVRPSPLVVLHGLGGAGRGGPGEGWSRRPPRAGRSRRWCSRAARPSGRPPSLPGRRGGVVLAFVVDGEAVAERINASAREDIEVRNRSAAHCRRRRLPLVGVLHPPGTTQRSCWHRTIFPGRTSPHTEGTNTILTGRALGTPQTAGCNLNFRYSHAHRPPGTTPWYSSANRTAPNTADNAANYAARDPLARFASCSSRYRSCRAEHPLGSSQENLQGIGLGTCGTTANCSAPSPTPPELKTPGHPVVLPSAIRGHDTAPTRQSAATFGLGRLESLCRRRPPPSGGGPSRTHRGTPQPLGTRRADRRPLPCTYLRC
jgi:hypothetical protein